jgi:hypothetical protein
MAQIFHPSTNTLARLSIFGAVFILAGLLWLLAALNRSSYATQEGVARSQPVPFSHQHHVGSLGIDCRYCHTTVDKSAFAGMPATEVCMTCHTHIWNTSPTLEPVRESLRTGQSIPWVRVYDLPDFTYFDHSIHIKQGIGCVSCHGRIDQMPLTWKAQSLHMRWCLECHREPERFVRPRAAVFSMDWEKPEEQPTLGKQLVEDYHITSQTTCSVCHR